MNALDTLECARGGPFTYRVNGQVRGLPAPTELPPHVLLDLLEHGFPMGLVDPIWKQEALTARYLAHYDLPSFRSAQRLVFLIDRYSDQIEYDLAQVLHQDLGDLFRGRRWRYLLNLIDRLPGHSYYAEAVANDPEHAALIAKAEAESEGGEKKFSPPLRTWSPEVAMMANILDAIKGSTHTMIALKTKPGSPPEPTPRPVTAIDAARKNAEYRRRLDAHKTLVERMLPHKRP